MALTGVPTRATQGSPQLLSPPPLPPLPRHHSMASAREARRADVAEEQQPLADTQQDDKHRRTDVESGQQARFAGTPASGGSRAGSHGYGAVPGTRPRLDAGVEDNAQATEKLSNAVDEQARATFNSSSLANATPLGLFSFGLVSLLTAFDKFGAGLDSLYVQAILVGGVGQFVSGMYDFHRNNTLGATTFIIFGSYWISQAVHLLLTQNRIDVAPPGKATGYACFYGVWTIFCSLTLVQTVRTNLALLLTVALSNIVFACDTVAIFFKPFSLVSGVFGLGSGISAFYCAFADLTNEVFARNLVPLRPNVEHAQDYEHQEEYRPRRHAHKAAMAIPSV